MTKDFILHVWRQKDAAVAGKLTTYQAKGISLDMSFLEMLDIVNDDLTRAGQEPIAFEHDCREGICGSCGFMVNGVAHGPRDRTTVCQLHMRELADVEEIVVEPWRARAFPIIKDLVVDRRAFDKIIQSGGYISVNTGQAQDGNAIPIAKSAADQAFEAAACIGCGACVAACPNASASLFTGAKITHLGTLPQGQPERHSRVQNMVKTMDDAGFGHCTNHGECATVCPKGISLDVIARMNRDLLKATLFGQD